MFMPLVIRIRSYKARMATQISGQSVGVPSGTRSIYMLTKGTSYSFIGDKSKLEFTPKELLTNEIIPRNVRLWVSVGHTNTT